MCDQVLLVRKIQGNPPRALAHSSSIPLKPPNYHAHAFFISASGLLSPTRADTGGHRLLLFVSSIIVSPTILRENPHVDRLKRFRRVINASELSVARTWSLDVADDASVGVFHELDAHLGDASPGT